MTGTGGGKTGSCEARLISGIVEELVVQAHLKEVWSLAKSKEAIVSRFPRHERLYRSHKKRQDQATSLSRTVRNSIILS